VRSQATFRTGTCASVTSDGPRGDDPPAGGVVEILASGFTRVARSNIPEAPVPATMAALADAGPTVDPVEAVTMNAYRCSLVWGILRPQPERARLLSSSPNSSSGGGVGLCTGCRKDRRCLSYRYGTNSRISRSPNGNQRYCQLP